MKKILKGAALILGGGFFLLAMYLVWYESRFHPNNRDYARQIFAEVETTRVLAARNQKVFLRDRSPWDWCSFAVVELGANAPANPPDFKQNKMQSFQFPVEDWKPTPGVLDRGETSYDHWCEPSFSADLFQRMTNAVQDEGGWIASVGRSQIVYSTKYRIAFYLQSTL